MHTLRIYMFGKFHIQCNGKSQVRLDNRKCQELLCYLLLYRSRVHAREVLASQFWPENSTSQSKKYLRQALWQLQAALDWQSAETGEGLLLVDHDWVQINARADYWLDVAALEGAYAQVVGVPGRNLDQKKRNVLQSGLCIYRGDLLEGWYQDWCLCERDRLHNVHLAMLDKMIAYCEINELYEDAQLYSEDILRLEPACERTHRRLMRIYVRAGNRTAALRQYQRCLAALDRELGVQPSQQTRALYHRIRAGQYRAFSEDNAAALDAPQKGTVQHLRQLQAVLNQLGHQVALDIQELEHANDLQALPAL